MFNNPYPVINLGGENHVGKNPHQSKYYKFKTPHREYFVTIDVFDFPMVAIKYCDLRDKAAKNRYRQIFNDGDAFRVIGTCLYVMLDYWRRNPTTNFSFHAAPRTEKKHEKRGKKEKKKATKEELKRQEQIRYIIYRYAMLNLFSYEDFTHTVDNKNSIYVMINKAQEKPSEVMDKLKEYLKANYDIVFNPDRNR